VGKKYYIFNKPYSPEKYEQLKNRIIQHMKQTGEYGQFFPGYFAANPYDESWASMYWPLTEEEQQKYGFRLQPVHAQRIPTYKDVSSIIEDSMMADESVAREIYWDDQAKRPFQIQKTDIAFAQQLGVPLPYTHYARRLQENFKWIPFSGTMRTVSCGKCHVEIKTGWPEQYEGRILCESCYQKEVY
jgi:hypothetical protein